MTEYEARAEVLRAGQRLVETGLIARTWGNVSCRVDSESFVVTPSGRDYSGLSPEDLVLCRVSDASHSGSIKPSIEKGIHALVYREKSGANFVVHTHQKWATAISASSLTDLNGSPVAAYAPAGAGRLVEKIRAVLPKAAESLLMSRHGALCFGGDAEAAFAAAQRLEESSQRAIIAKYTELSGDKKPLSLRQVLDYCAKAGGNEPASALTATSRRESDSFLFLLNGTEIRYTRLSGDMPEEARLHEEVYRLRPDVTYIESTADDAVVSFSLKKEPLFSMLDDTAQMMGVNIKNAGSAVSGIAAAIKGGKRAVLFSGRGGLSFAGTKDEAVSGRLILEKNAAAALCAGLFGDVRPMSAFDCRLQHMNYLKKYSKIAGK